MGHAVAHLEIETWNFCSEEQIVYICRKTYFSISAVQGTSVICLEGSEGNYKKVKGGLKGKGLKYVGNWDTLALLLMA